MISPLSPSVLFPLVLLWQYQRCIFEQSLSLLADSVRVVFCVGSTICLVPSLTVRFAFPSSFHSKHLIKYSEGLRKAVAIPSISAQDENRKDVFKVYDADPYPTK